MGTPVWYGLNERNLEPFPSLTGKNTPMEDQHEWVCFGFAVLQPYETINRLMKAPEEDPV